MVNPRAEQAARQNPLYDGEIGTQPMGPDRRRFSPAKFLAATAARPGWTVDPECEE